MSDELVAGDLVALTRRILDVWNSGDLEAWSQFYARDATFDSTRTNGVLLHGREQLRDYQREWRTAYEELAVVAEELVDHGNGVIFGVYRQTGRLAGTTAFLAQREPMIGIVEDGLVVELTVFPEAAVEEARAAAEQLAAERSS